MLTKTEKAPPQGLPNTHETNSNGTVAHRPTRKPDARNGFTMIPNAVLLNSSLSMGARQTLVLLVHHQGVNAESWPSQKKLAAELGVASVRQVQRYLRELEKAELVETRQMGLRRTNRYRVLNPGSDTAVSLEQGCVAKPVNITEATCISRPKERRTSKPVPPPTSFSYEKSVVVVTGQQAKSPHHEMDINVQKGEEQQLASSHSTFTYTEEDFEQLGGCLAALYSLHCELDLELVGIEPPRSGGSSGQVAERTGGERVAEVEGVVVNQKVDARGHYRLVFADGREFGLGPNKLGGPNTAAVAEVMKLYGRHVRFPVNGRGNVAARPKQVLVSTVEGEATSFACFSCHEAGTLHRVSIDSRKRLLCSDCRAEADEKERRRQEERQSEDERMPWEQPAAEALPWERDTAKPLEQAGHLSDDTPHAVERLPWDEPQQAPATKSDLERIERKIGDLPADIAMAIGGHPAEEAEQILAEPTNGP